MSNATQHKKALLATFLGYMIWGVGFMFARVALQILPFPAIMLTIRFIAAFAMMNLLVLCGAAKIRFRGKNLRPLLILAISEPIYFFLETYGILYTNATFAGSMSAATPIAAIAMAAVFLKEYPTKKMILWSLLPIIGVIVITVAGNDLGIIQPIGVVCLIGLLFTAGAYRTANRSSSAEFSSFERFYAVLTACTAAFTPIGIYQISRHTAEVKAALSDGRFLLAVAMLAIFGSVLANILVNYGAAHLSVAALSTMGALQTVCSSVTGVLLLGEPISLWLLSGIVLIIFGVYMAAQEEQRRKI